MSGPASPSGKPAGAFSAWEVGLALRYLRAKRKEGGVATIAVISFIGIMLAVAVLISVMSIMAGFRAELLGRILSFNGHMYVQGPVLYAPDRDAALKRIADVPGVVAVTPLIESPAMRGLVSHWVFAADSALHDRLAAVRRLAEHIDPPARRAGVTADSSTGSSRAFRWPRRARAVPAG